LEKEVSQSVELGVTLMAISILLGLIFFTVYLGNGIKADAGEGLSDVKNEISINYINALAKGEVDNDMPTATAYNIFKTYDKVILETANGYDGTVKILMSQGSDLSNNLSGRVQLELKEVPGGGAYVAFIHTGQKLSFDKGFSTCTWYVGTCTCQDKTGFTAVKSKYKVITTW
jgi:hypothetical protein